MCVFWGFYMIFALFSHSCSPFAEEMFLNIFATPWTIAHRALLFMGFSGLEYWSGLLFSSPGDLPHLGTEPRSPALQADSLLSESPGKPWCLDVILTKCIYIGLTLSNSSLQQTQCLPNLSTGTCHNPGLACFVCFFFFSKTLLVLMNWEFWISRYKLLYTGWTNNQALLQSTGNSSTF